MIISNGTSRCKMILYGNKVKLTGIELKDQMMLNDLMNDPSAEEGIESAFWPISQYQQEKWFMENYKKYRLPPFGDQRQS